MNWILIAVLAILIGNALIGLRVGFIKTIFFLSLYGDCTASDSLAQS